MGWRILLVLFLVASACGADRPGEQPPSTVAVLLWNQSQFELLEVRVHPEPDFRGAANLLDVPMDIGDLLMLEFPNGQYITVIRQRVDVGETMAVSVPKPLHLTKDGYELLVFDESFRLVEP